MYYCDFLAMQIAVYPDVGVFFIYENPKITNISNTKVVVITPT